MDTRLISNLEITMQRRLSALPQRLRPFTTEQAPGSRALVLTGPRGVGKTTYLLHHIQGKRILYLSADNPGVADRSLYDLVRDIFLVGYEGVIIDEVHFAKDWSLHVKAIYDDFPSNSIWISDSSSLVLRNGIGDLSRRYLQLRMPLLSFREFLYLETGRQYPIFNPFFQSGKLPVEPTPEILDAFQKYRTMGTRPFYGQGDFQDRLLAVLDKTLYSDIPFFLPGITDGNLRLMKAIVGNLASAAIPRLHVRSLCSDWGIGSDKLYQLLEVMESVGVLRSIRIENDTKAKSVGAKLFFSDPAFYSALTGNVGTAREAFVAAFFAEAQWKVEAVKNEMDGDFVISKTTKTGDANRITIEVGGASKKPKQADFVIRDDADYPAGKAIPMWLLGFMY